MMNKNNVPYYIAGTLATFTLLASGVFAAAPYAQFLAPVAALSVGLPFIIGCAVFSVVTIALSYKAISKNKTISERDAQLAKQAEEIKSKDIQLAGEKSKVEAKDKTISKKDALLIEKNKKIEEDKLEVAIADGTVQLAKGILDSVGSGMNKVYNAMPSIESAKEKLSNAFDAVGNGLRNTYSVMPSVKFAKDIQTASQKAFASVKEAYSSGRVPGIVKRGLTDVYYPPIESAKETISSVGDKLKNVYGTSVEYTKGELNSVVSSLYIRIYGTKVSSPEEQFKREDGSKPSMQELTRLDYLDLVVPSSKQEQADKKVDLDYLDLAISKNLNHLNVDISSPESQPAEKEETKVSGYFNQVVSTANWLTSQATKAMPYLAASCLPYVFYNYAITPVSESFDDVNVTQSFVANSGITSTLL